MSGKLTLPKAIAAAVFLAACGQAPTSTIAPLAPGVSATVTATQQEPTPSAPPTVVARATVTFTSPTSTPPAVNATIEPPRVALAYKGIEQGLTADGFPYLGRADAPITLTDYSDFL